MRVAIAGAGAVGRSVAQELVDYGHKVLLIEKDFHRYEPDTARAGVYDGLQSQAQDARVGLWASDACTIAGG